MKTTFFIVFVACIIILMQSCFQMEFINGSQMTFYDGAIKTTIKYDGKIEFTDDESSIKSISQGGYLEFKSGNTKYKVGTDGNGNLVHKLNGKIITLNYENKQQIALILQKVLDAGVNAEERVKRLYEKGGINLVMDKMSGIKSEFALANAMKILLSFPHVTTHESAKIVGFSKRVESDFELANVIMSVKPEYYNDATVFESCLSSVLSIESDYETSQTLKFLVEHTNDIARHPSFAQAVETIESDYERKEVMLKAVKTGSDMTQLLSAMQHIENSYEKAEVALALASVNNPSSFRNAVGLTATIESDYERARSLKAIIEGGQKPDDVEISLLIKAISDINSDYEKVGVVKSLVQNITLNDEQYVLLIKTCETVESAYEKENALTSIAPNLKHTMNAKVKFMDVAKTMNNDEYGRLMRLVVN